MLYKILLTTVLLLQFSMIRAQDRYWVHKPFYQNFFTTAPELAEWSLVEDDGTGGFTLSGSGTAVLKMDGSNFANRIFSVNAGAVRYLPLDSILGRLEINILRTTGGTQRFFVQAQTFTAANVYINQVNILPATVGQGFFSINMRGLAWPADADKVRFIIGGANFSSQQGTIEFDYLSYSNSNGTWSNSANWSATSGGAGGASVPDANTRAVFDGVASSNGSCQVDLPISIRGVTLGNSYSGNVDLQNFAVTLGSDGLTMSGGGFSGNQASVTNNGNLTITGGTYKSSSRSNINAGNIAITGGNVNLSEGSFLLNAALDQSLQMPSSVYFHRLLIDKTSNLNLASQLTIQDSLVLTNGTINTVNDTIYIGSSLASPGVVVPGGAGRINGPVKKWVAALGNITIPFGGTNFNAPLLLDVITAPASGGYLSFAYKDSANATRAVSFNDGATIIRSRSRTVWSIGSSQITGGAYNLSLSTNSFNYNGSLSDLHLVSALGTNGTHLAATGVVANPTVKRTGLTLTGITNNHYIGTSVAALPLKWLHFSASNSSNKPVTLNWTITEYGVNKFELQRSTDNSSFITIATITSRGEGLNNYLYSDGDLVTKSFYRVKSIDMDGTVDYSAIVSISPLTSKVMMIKEKIFSNDVNVMIPDVNGASWIQLTDMQGRVVFQKKVSQSLVVIPASNLPTGVYNLAFMYKGIVYSERLFKK